MTNVPQRYVPRNLTRRDKKNNPELNKSRKMYKSGKYHTRKKLSHLNLKHHHTF